MSENIIEFSGDSWITHVMYNKKTRAMLVSTQKSSFECQDVPLKVYESFSQASSKGKYFNSYIKGKYMHEYF